MHLAGTQHFMSNPEATYDLAAAAHAVVDAGNAAFHAQFVKHGQFTSQVEGSHAASMSSAHQAVQKSALAAACDMLQHFTAAIWVEARGTLGRLAKPSPSKLLVEAMKADGAL